MDVLDAAQKIKHRKNQISTKSARDSFKPFQKSLGCMWRKKRGLPQANRDSTPGRNTAAPVTSASLFAAPMNNEKLVNTLTNAKFIPTATKPAGWVKT